MNRPSFKELMEDVQNNMLDAVMVYKLDRITSTTRKECSLPPVSRRMEAMPAGSFPPVHLPDAPKNLPEEIRIS